MGAGGIIASALAGGADVLGRQAGDQVQAQTQLDMRTQLLKLEEEKQLRIAEATSNLGLAADKKRLEQERDFSVAPATLAAKNKVAENDLANKPITTSLGQEVYKDGKLYVKNQGLTAPEARAGGTGKVDHFDEKAWDTAMKVDPAAVTYADPISGKSREVPELRQVYLMEMNKFRQRGDSAPNLAAEQARNTVLRLRNAAEDMANSEEGRKANMTPEMAIKQILSEYEKARRGPAPTPGKPAVSPAAAAAKPPAAPAAGLVDGARAPVDQMREMSTSDLKRLAAIKGHVNQAAAAAELKRREQEAQDVVPSDAAGALNLGA